MEPGHLESIRQFERPMTNKQLQRWLGLCTSLREFASSPLKDRLLLQRGLLRKNYVNHLPWNPEQVAEFETARAIFFSSSQMLKPFDQALALGLLADTVKTTGIGFILFQFDLRYPPGQRLPEGAEMLAGPMNFALQGAWSVGAKGSWVDLSPIEAEIVGYWHATRRLHYHIRGAPIIYGFDDHQPFAELYERKSMSKLTPRILKLMKELMEYQFKMK